MSNEIGETQKAMERKIALEIIGPTADAVVCLADFLLRVWSPEIEIRKEK